MDLATKLRLLQRALRSRVERRGALLDIVRAVNSTLEPPKVADHIVERAATWVPAPCWAVVSSDRSGQLSVLADRGLTPDMGPPVHAVAEWVMGRGQEFFSASLAEDTRLRTAFAGAIVALPLSCRGRRVGALVGLDRTRSAREPRLAAGMLRTIRVLLEPAAVALDNALLLQRAEALSVTDDLTHLYNSRYLNLVLRRETKRASRSGRPLSLLFIDLDGFKSINDTHGHLCGSRALVEVAALYVADFYREVIETPLSLPDDIKQKLNLESRGRGRIWRIVPEGTRPARKPALGKASAEELVQAADKAMYQVKDSGKNGIQAAAAPADT